MVLLRLLLWLLLLLRHGWDEPDVRREWKAKKASGMAMLVLFDAKKTLIDWEYTLLEPLRSWLSLAIEPIFIELCYYILNIHLIIPIRIRFSVSMHCITPGTVQGFRLRLLIYCIALGHPVNHTGSTLTPHYRALLPLLDNDDKCLVIMSRVSKKPVEYQHVSNTELGLPRLSDTLHPCLPHRQVSTMGYFC